MSFLMLPIMAIPAITGTLGLNQYIGQIPVVVGAFESIMTNMNPMNMITDLMGMGSSLLKSPNSSTAQQTETELICIVGAGLGALFLL